ncbi:MULTISPECIES: putative leader peptide [unclassified Streptomyces]|uniref:putative leader peptide n=1 Tax=unclassified Streptomyces TaxID=2593676 RepID=UPI0036CD5910
MPYREQPTLPSHTGVRADTLRGTVPGGRCHMCERTAPPMPYQPIAAGATPPSRAAGTHRAGFFRPRLAARRHIDLHRVSSAICQA